jgi:peptidyl-tRNA hydrolase, PTH1 family
MRGAGRLPVSHLDGLPVTGLALKLIVGLGNPGAQYARTRHNAGWWFVDALLAQQRGNWRREPRFQAELARVLIEKSELWLGKPGAYMNQSGAPVAAIAQFYRIAPQEMLIVHDDIDLPPGVVRLKEGGGHGGHNGLRDIVTHIGADFWRLRIGVGHPGAKELVIGAVLDRPTLAEQQLIDTAVERGLEAIPELIRDGAQRAMHRLHRRDAGESAP